MKTTVKSPMKVGFTKMAKASPRVAVSNQPENSVMEWVVLPNAEPVYRIRKSVVLAAAKGIKFSHK